MQPGEVVAGRFMVQRFVGAGGMGTVYYALDREHRSPVALKILHSPSADATERFVREARVLSELEHPAIVRYVASGDGYLAMEWLEGEDLAARLRRAPLTVGESIALVERVAAALALAHARGVVHRDVKPANVFLPDCLPRSAKVLDFGIARDLRGVQGATKTGVIVGTLGYVAPEQARGERDLSAPADVFALGCVLLECLTGRPAFEGANAIAILSKILVEDAPRLRERRSDLPTELGNLVQRMLAKDPRQRPADAAAVRDALAAFSELDGPAPNQLDSPTPATPVVAAHELQFVTIVLAGPEPRGNLPDAGATIADESNVIQLAGRAGAASEVLVDGSLLFVFAGAGVATDRAASAARIGLALRRAYPSRSVVIATGRAMVGAPIATMPDVRSRMPVGEALDRASALLVRAVPASHVHLDTVTAGLLGGRFDVVEREHEILLLGESHSDAERKLVGRPTPCVGRDRELRMLEATADEAFGARTPAAVLVIADAGVGKSRLEYELARRLRSRVPDVEVWRTEGTPLSAGSPLSMLATLVRRLSDIADDDPPAARQHKLTHRVGKHVSPTDVARVAAFLGELVGARFAEDATPELASARLEPHQRTQAVHRAWDDFLDAETAAHPVLFVLEDLQWGDRHTIDRVDAALAREDRALLVLALARPTVVETFGELWREHGVQELRLRELPRRACLELARSVLGDVEPKLLEAIVDRAGGHAFFLEEILRSFAARGSATTTGVELPETVIAMLGSRLARLDSWARRVLRAASVFGETFWAAAVASLLGIEANAPELAEAFRVLVAAEMISRRSDPRFRGEDELVFRHALVREAAYATFLAADLPASHALAGEWLEKRGEADPKVLAEHFERGAVDDASWARAATSWNRAAIQASQSSAHYEAVELSRRALAAVARIESAATRAPIEISAQISLGVALVATRGQSSVIEQAFGTAIAVAEATGDERKMFRALQGLFGNLYWQSRFTETLVVGARSLRIAEHLRRPDLLLEAHRVAWMTQVMTGDFSSARGHIEAGLALFETAKTKDQPLLLGSCWSILGVLEAIAGFPSRAREANRRAIAFASEKNHVFSLGAGFENGMVAGYIIGDTRWSQDCAKHALELVSQRSSLDPATARILNAEVVSTFAWIESHALAGLGWIDARSGEPEQGLAKIEQAQALLRDAGIVLGLTMILVFHAEVALHLVRPAVARQALDEAEAFEAATGEAWSKSERLRVLAALELHEGRAELAEQRLRESIADARDRGALMFELRSCVRLAELWTKAGRAADAKAMLGAIYARFTEGFDEVDLVQARAMLAASP